MRQGLSLLACALCAALVAVPAAQAAVKGPLRVLESNPRYFTDGTGKAVYLTGSHVWWNLGAPDWTSGCWDAPAAFDWDRHLDWLADHDHNFVRLWRVEHTRWTMCFDDLGNPRQTTTAFHPWPRTGPGTAHDGGPRFDLGQLDQAYFDRLRARVEAANEHGIYVSVMLFEGWWLHSVDPASRWVFHPFHADNNVNGVDGDADADGLGTEIVTLAPTNAAILAIQEAYVEKVVETVNDLPNVLYEIANEAGAWSTQWQYHMIRFVKGLQPAGQKRPVGMTYPHLGGNNKLVFRSPADWVSPWAHRYMTDPPPADGRKVVVSDTDHHCGICGPSDAVQADASFAWRSLTRGLNPIYMDVIDEGAHDPVRTPIRDALGQTLRWSKRIDLAASRPRGHVSSTGYALTVGRRQYLVYQPKPRAFRVDLRKATGRFRVEWYRPAVGRSTLGKRVRGGAVRRFAPPFRGPAVLFLRRL